MSRLKYNKPSIVELAERIEADIRSRGLQPGDPYLGQAETTKLLGVGTGSANLALQLLSQRGILSRTKRKGTFVANLDPSDEETAIERVYLILPQDFLQNEGFFADGHILGIQGELPGADIVFSFLPQENEQEEFVNQLVHDAIGMKKGNGFILASSTFITQKIFSDSGLPSVIGGSPYPTIDRLPWVDSDHRKEAKLISSHLLKRGCKKILLLIRSRTLPGEQVFLDSLSAEFGKAGMPYSDVITRGLPNDPKEIEATIRDLLHREPLQSCKLGIIARNEPLANGFLKVFKTLPKEIKIEFELVSANIHQTQNQELKQYPFVRDLCDPQERGRIFGELLKQIVQKQELAPHIVPVELVVP